MIGVEWSLQASIFAPNVLHLAHSRAGPVCNSSQQAGDICLHCQEWMLCICLYTNSVDAASASQVGSPKSVSNAFD